MTAEAENSGAKEIVLTGVDISSYGKNTGTSLAALCRALKDVPARKRLGSLEVSVVSDELLDAMEEGGYFYIGHAESVPKYMPFVKVAPAIYRKLGGDKK